jgi:hypothetical protein
VVQFVNSLLRTVVFWFTQRFYNDASQLLLLTFGFRLTWILFAQPRRFAAASVFVGGGRRRACSERKSTWTIRLNTKNSKLVDE